MVRLQVVSGARKARRAPSLHQWKTPIEANSTKASDESNFNTLDLKGSEIKKKNDAKDKEG